MAPRRHVLRLILSLGIPFVVAVTLLLASTRAPAAVEIVLGSGFEEASLIELIQRHSADYVTMNVHIGPALVTGVRATASTSTFFVQIPPAFAGRNYPLYSGIKAFSATLIAGLAVGDCVSFDGTVIEFQGATDLSPVSNLLLEVASACGALPVLPFVIGVPDIASDVENVTAGFQPGPLSEAFEGVLVRIGPVVAAASSLNGVFPVTEPATVPRMDIGSLMFDYSAVVSEAFPSITGIVDQQGTNAANEYRLLPRTAIDVQH